MEIQLELSSSKHLAILLSYVRAYHEFEEIELSDDRREAGVTKLLSENPFGRIWMILRSGEVIGYIALCWGYSIEEGGRDAFLDEFYIDEQYRGQGFGRQALEAVQAEAVKFDVQALHLEVARTNERARRLYESTGFVARERYVIMTNELGIGL